MDADPYWNVNHELFNKRNDWCLQHFNYFTLLFWLLKFDLAKADFNLNLALGEL